MTSYYYYDTPDGEDSVKKILFTTKYAAISGFFLSTVDVMLISQPVGYLNTLARIYAISAPIIGGTALGTAAVATSTNYRNKDDEWNHFIGGALGSITYGLLKGSIATAARAFPPCSIIAASLKHCQMNGLKLNDLDKVRPRLHDAWSIKKHDWSLVKDPKDLR